MLGKGDMKKKEKGREERAARETEKVKEKVKIVGWKGEGGLRK